MDWGWLQINLPNWIIYPSLVFCIVGLLIIVWGILSMSDNLTPYPTPKKDSNLVSTGVYSYIRHPIYSGILLSFFAFGIYSFSLFKIIIVILLALVLYFKSNLEEKLLLQRYQEYSAYIKKTGRFFPKIRS
ncbi:methyltransferase family protein [Rasiella sp. SM2506]|uniref:methyltransferase family protein n=1 Tax=Rasiella sp. SM2506 TaxID=3423914 RepID=UPI003D79747D